MQKYLERRERKNNNNSKVAKSDGRSKIEIMFLEIFEEAQFERPNQKSKQSNEEENNQT